jgi:SagB-type dehydrogenase family enzyme
MFNKATEKAWQYHNRTNHSYWSVRSTPHFLDFENKPLPFKIYPELAPFPLPKEFPATGIPTLAAIASQGIERGYESQPTLAQLASILFYSVGITKTKTYPGGEIYFRAAACAGALYPVEVYVVCGDMEGLKAGIYHFNPGDFSLRCLREGDYRVNLAQASSQEVADASITLIYSAITWRSSWKYRDRSYRYHFWDNGMILANALAMAASHNLPAKVLLGFLEDPINKLTGIDGEKELVLSLLTLGYQKTTNLQPQAVDELNFAILPLSDSQVDYPSIREMHLASSFTDPDEIGQWRKAKVENRAKQVFSQIITLAPLTPEELPKEAIEGVIERRASTRRFAHKAISFAELSVILDRATGGIDADFLPAKDLQLNDIYLIVNSVQGLDSGSYFYCKSKSALELLQAGDFRDKASYLTLEQSLGGDASVTLFFMTDLNALLEEYGNRGYRAAQMEAGIIGGKAYLAAYALKRGATGLTFYDTDVTDFFSPHAEGKNCIFAFSIGVPGKKPLL